MLNCQQISMQSQTHSITSPLMRCTAICTLTIVFLSSSFLTALKAQYPSVAYQNEMAKAVRATANYVLPSIVVIEIVGGNGTPIGEVAHDAPTSGVIVDSRGYVLASDLIVRQTSASILVVTGDGTRHAAKVISRDHHRGLVLLKIDADSELPAIKLPESVSLSIGQSTVAVGRYGLDASPIVSQGILSATERLDGIALQTDARISASLYGGLLVDLYGNALGIVVPAVAAGGAENETSWYDSGIAFAIPVTVIKKKLDRMIDGEDIKKGLVGIVAEAKDPYAENTRLAAVRVRSPAEKAGIKPGDLVKSVDGEEVVRHQQVRQILGRFDAGEKIGIEVVRRGETRSFELTLADTIPPLEPQRIGIVISEQRVDEEEDTKLVVDEVLEKSPADGKLKEGDVIVFFDGIPSTEIASLRRRLISAEPGGSIELEVRRGNETEQFALTPSTIDSGDLLRIPTSWLSSESRWRIEPLSLPESANKAAVIVPNGGGENETMPDQLGCLILLVNPGDGDPEKVLESWKDMASLTGVVVCAVAPEANERWQAKEIEVMPKLVASIKKTQPIDPSAVAIAAPGALSGVKAEASDSMALAVAMSESQTFSGVAVSSKTRPPAVKLRENDAESSLQILLPMSADGEPPSWASTLRRSGYPIVIPEDVSREVLLTWVRMLQSI